MRLLWLLFALEVGAVTQPGWVVNGFYEQPEPGPVYYTEFEADVTLLEVLFLNTTLRTDVKPVNSLLSWSPFWVTYAITLGLRVGPVEMGWRHLCTHPMQPYITYYGVSVPVLEGSFDEVYLRFEAGNR